MMNDDEQWIELGKRLKELVDARYKSQNKFSETIGVSNSNIEDIFKGKRKLSGMGFKKVAAIAKGLDLSLDGLADGKLVPYGKSKAEFSDEEWQIIEKYRKLDEQAQRRVRRNLNAEYDDAQASLAEESLNATGAG